MTKRKPKRTIRLVCPGCGIAFEWTGASKSCPRLSMFSHLRDRRYCRDFCCEDDDLLVRVPFTRTLVLRNTLHAVVPVGRCKWEVRGLTPDGSLVTASVHRIRGDAVRKIKKLLDARFPMVGVRMKAD